MKRKSTTIKTGDYKYVTLSVRGKDGKIHYSRGNGDAVHRAMLVHVANGGTVQQVISANGFDKFGTGGNDGTLRMSVGVALRAAVRAGEPVKIGGLTVKSLKQAVALPKVDKKAPAPRKAKSKKPAKRKASKPRTRSAPATDTQAAAPAAA